MGLETRKYQHINPLDMVTWVSTCGVVVSTSGYLTPENRRTVLSKAEIETIPSIGTLSTRLSCSPCFQFSLMRRPNINFRVLVIGRANAGKTSILQRVCDTTESPKIYRKGLGERCKRVCGHTSS